MQVTDFNDRSDQEVFQLYCNARVTSYCLGHHKSDMNDFYAGTYLAELKKRNSELVDKTKGSFVDINTQGIYNGEGSY